MSNRYDNYLFRCSSLGKIVSKSGKMTQGIQSYLLELFIEDTQGVKKEISSKYFEKGKFCEEDGFDLLNETLYKGRLIIKNKVRKGNDYITGEMDTLAPDDILYDIKNAYDRFTFGKADLTWEYEQQLYGYCWLWLKEKARLFYCLNNMPEHMIVDEERKAFYKGNYMTFESPEYLEVCEELRKFHNYDNMELWERFKYWDVTFTKDNEERIKKSVIEARKELNKMYDEHLAHINKNKIAMGLEPDLILATHDDEVKATIIEPEFDLSKLKKISKD